MENSVRVNVKSIKILDKSLEAVSACGDGAGPQEQQARDVAALQVCLPHGN